MVFVNPYILSAKKRAPFSAIQLDVVKLCGWEKRHRTKLGPEKGGFFSNRKLGEFESQSCFLSIFWCIFSRKNPFNPRICWILSVASAVAPDGRGGGDPVPEARRFCSSLVVMVDRMRLRVYEPK